MRSLFTTVVLSDPRYLGRLPLQFGITKPPSIPFTPLPIELVRLVLEYAASTNIGGKPPYQIQLTSRCVRRWTYPILYETLEIFGLRRMIQFATIFCSPITPSSILIGSIVKNLSLFDDTTGDFVHLSNAADALDNNTFMVRILETCKSVQRLAINYIRGIPNVDGLTPFELTVRRGLRGIDLSLPPFQSVTRIHCRYEQLMPYVLPKLAITRLTHVCFVHHLDFPEETLFEVITSLLEQSQMECVIVEMAYQRWHALEDPSIRQAMADKWGPEETRLVIRLSGYETVKPYDKQGVFDGTDIWDVKESKDWRTIPWTEETIKRVCRILK